MNKLLLALCTLAAACSQPPKPELPLLPASAFETTVDGKPVSLYTIHAGDITLQATNYGARVVTLFAPDREGVYEDIVLGYPSIGQYIDNPGERFLGAVVGPYANRIAKGRFTLDSVEYTLPLNNNGQTLHGGLSGLDRVVWEVVSANDSTLVLSYLHPDAQDGFPGNLRITMTYAVTSSDEFRVEYTATTDKATVVNLSHHSFFNLLGEGNGPITGHELTIRGSYTTPVDSGLIPLGTFSDVTGTPFDFRQPHAIGERIDADDEQLRNGSGYDHNWVIDPSPEGGIVQVASVYEPAKGRVMEVWSDQPGLQFYSGNFFDGTTTGKYGRPLRWRESIALETQRFPDSPNQPAFPSTVLRPSETYTQTCIYKFATK